jgi:hypothetical protein
LTPAQVEQAASVRGAFAEGTVAQLAGLIGLPAGRPQRHYIDLEGDAQAATQHLYFEKQAKAAAPAPDGPVVLRNYFDPDNSRKLMVYPAAWPMPPGREEILTWLMLSEGAGFTGGTARIEVTGPPGLEFSHGFFNGAKFHNGQIVGGYELPNDASLEAGQAYLASKRFVLQPDGPPADGRHCYSAAYPNLYVPAMTPQRTTQIILVLQLHVSAATPGEWDVRITLSPGDGTGIAHILPGARVAVMAKLWLPVVSGLNPKAAYDTSDMPESPLPDQVFDYLAARSGDYRYRHMEPAAIRAMMEDAQAKGRPREYANWLHDVQYTQKRAATDCRLDCPAIAMNVAILRHAGQATLDLYRAYIEQHLRPMLDQGGELRLRAERQMTETAHVGKTRKTWPLRDALRDKAWAKLFDAESDYQAVTIELIPEGAEIPMAGLGLHATMVGSRRVAARLKQSPDQAADYNDRLLHQTLAKMRGHTVPATTPGETMTLHSWVVNHPAGHAFAHTSPQAMKQQLNAFAETAAPLQAWHGAATWIPVFDTAGDYENTVYEDQSVLNFFRGILHGSGFGLHDHRLAAAWCANVLRMVTPDLWLGPSLSGQLDLAALAKAATVTQVGEVLHVEKRNDCALEDFELALLPVLPVETARIGLRST